MRCLISLLPLLSLALASQNLVDLATLNNATTLTSFVQQAGLTDVLREQGPFTLIVPVNSAFAKIPADQLSTLQQDTSALANVLQYHVVKGMIYSWDMISGEILTSLNGHYIRVYTQGNQLFFNQAKVLKVDIQGSNGVIYLVDEVLNVPEGTIDDIIMNPDYNISMFMDILKAARMVDLFNRTTTQRYTVFVPSNAAISTLDPTVLARIKSSLTYARYIVDYHVHAGTLHSKSLDHSGRISTLYNGHYISVTADNTNGVNIKLNNAASITVADIEAENGVVHIITHVLIPSTLSGIIG